jgi:peptidoglycan/xylan/chitin deacetylase (PgdA/CDA1 family)
MRSHLVMDVPFIAAGIALWPHYGAAPAAALAATSTLVHTWAVLDPRSSFYLRVNWRLRADCRELALSFDDGPHPEATPRILDLLAEHGMRATFFPIGRNIAGKGALLRRIHVEGHCFGLHSFSHSRLFNCWPAGRVRRDLEANGHAIADALGTAPPTLWRPPVGLKNPIVAFVAGQMGLTAVTWTARGLDTRRHVSSAGIVARLRRAVAPRTILALHDGHEPEHPRDPSHTVAATAALLPILKAAGLPSRGMIPDARRVIAAREPATAWLPARVAPGDRPSRAQRRAGPPRRW